MKNLISVKSWFAIVAILVCCGKPVEADPKPITKEPPESKVKCVRERRMHAYGTYRASSYQREDQDLPIDLTIVECLEWGTDKL